MTHSSEPSTPKELPNSSRLLTSPGDLYASIPGLFGFYPKDSLVLSTFVASQAAESHHLSDPTRVPTSTEGSVTSMKQSLFLETTCPTGGGQEPLDTFPSCGENPQRLVLGASFRLDLRDLGLLPNLADTVRMLSSQLNFAFLIGASYLRHHDEIVNQLMECSSSGALPIHGVWCAPLIQTGQLYERVFGGIPPFTQDVGTIPEITASPTMHMAIERNELPAVSREELFESFTTSWDIVSRADAREIAGVAARYRADVMRITAHELNDLLASVVDDVEVVLRESTMQVDSQFGGLVCALNTEDLTTLCTYLLKAPLRDVLLPLAVEHPSAVRAVALAVARNSEGDIRSNALCWYAIAATADNLTNRAIPALQTALEEDSCHRLASLLLTALRLGRPELVITAAEHARAVS